MKRLVRDTKGKLLFVWPLIGLFVVVVVGLLLGFSSPTSAQTMNTINFQGKVVRNDAGSEGLNVSSTETTCISGGADTCGFQVVYYDASTGGNTLGTETFTNVEIGDYDGVVNLGLGTGSYSAGTESTFIDIFTNNSTTYAEVKFDHDGNATYTEVFGRMAVRGSAYAIHADTADSINGMDEGDFVQFAPSSVQTDTSTSSSIFINKTGASGNILQLQKGGSDVLVLDNDGLFGIGTGTLSSALNIDSGTNDGIQFVNTLDQDGQIGVDMEVSADTDGDTVYGYYTVVGAGTGTATTASRYGYGSYYEVDSAVEYSSGNLAELSGIGMSLSIDSSVSLFSMIYGIRNVVDLSGGGAVYGLYNQDDGILTSGNAGFSGIYNDIREQETDGFLTGVSNLLEGKGVIYGVSSVLTSTDSSEGEDVYGYYAQLGTNHSSSNAYGLYVFDASSGITTAGTQYGVYLDMDNTNTTNYSVYVESGSGDSYFGSDVGIGDSSPDSAFTVGSSSEFQVNSSGAIAAATGITSSGTITFSGLSDGFVTSSSGVLSGGGSADNYQYWIYQIDGGSQDNVSSTNTLNFAAGNDIDIADTATRSMTFNIESTLNYVSTITRASSSLTLSTTTSGDITLNPAGNVDLSADIIPDTDDTYDIGSTSFRIQDLYLGPTSLHIGEDGDEGVVSFNTTDDRVTVDTDASIAGLTVGKGGSGLTYNTILGVNALANTTGDYNTALGYEALNENVGNSTSTALGYRAMYYADNRVSGRDTYNTAVGYEALRGSVSAAGNTGRYNTAIGYSSLLLNTTGNHNTAVGFWSLERNTTGYNNVALGSESLFSNEANIGSTSVGFMSMYYADDRTTGRETFNTALGAYALRGSATASDNTGRYNTAIGQNALFFVSSGEYNTALGVYALDSVSTGSNNVAIGFDAGENLTSGSTNILIGYGIDAQSATGDNQMSIGNLIFASGGFGTGTTVGTGNVGIGDASPAAKLVVGNGDLFQVNSSGAIAAATGITSSGTITFSGLSTAGVTMHDASGILGTATVETCTGDDKLQFNGTNFVCDADESGAPTAGDDTDVSGTQVNIESQLDYVSTITRASSSLTLSTTTSGAIYIDPIDAVVIGNVGGTNNVGLYVPDAIYDVDDVDYYLDLHATSYMNTVYLGGDLSSGTGDLYIADRIIDWDSSTYYIDPNSSSVLATLSLDNDLTVNSRTIGAGAGDLAYNNVFGQVALGNNTTGNYNNAFGNSALMSNTTGDNNVAIGHGALVTNVGNDRSTAVGAYSMQNADNRVTGRTTANTAVGYAALMGSATAANNTGQNNTAIGDSAMMGITSGGFNVGIGVSSLLTNTSGSNNIGLGFQAGDNITTGSSNIIIGYNVDAPSATVSNQLSIGNVIFATGGFGTGTTLGTGNVGIGDASPGNRLDIGTTTSDSSGISFNGDVALTSDSGDDWLRLNQDSDFADGVFTPGDLRVDGNIDNNGTIYVDRIVGTGGVNGIGDQYSLIPNASFEINEDSSTTVPDGWSYTASGASTIAVTDGVSHHGNSSVSMTASSTTSPLITSQCIPISNSASMRFHVWAKDTGSGDIVVRAKWYNSSSSSSATCGTYINYTDLQWTSPGSSWSSYGASGVTPASGARWARLEIYYYHGTGTLSIDAVKVFADEVSRMDLAENFYTYEELNPGEIVTNYTEGLIGVRATRSPEDTLLGVISTAPGVTLGNEYNGSDYSPVALSGRVPVIVSSISGDIEVGDHISASVVDGVGKRSDSFGYSVGTALESNSDWSSNRCPIVPSYGAIVWPEDDGTNQNKPCYRVPISSLNSPTRDVLREKYNLSSSDYFYVGKLMTFMNIAWYEPPSKLAILEEMIKQYAGGLSSNEAELVTSTPFENLIVQNSLSVGSGFTVSSIGDVSVTGDILLGDNLIKSDTGGVVFSKGVTAGALTANKYFLTTIDGEDSSAGIVTIPAGETEYTVTTNMLTKDSLIFVTPSLPVSIGSKKTGESTFDINLGQDLPEDVEVSWWIIN